MSNTIQFTREIPVRHRVDIFVAGGGPAGVTAAIAAQRGGASVYLVEGQACFGGMGTSGLVPAFMQFGDGVTFLAAGLGREIYENLKQETTLFQDDVHGNVSIDVEAFKRVYDQMMVDSGVEFTFQTQLIGVEAENGTVKSAICWGKSGIFAVQANVYIDATGDGDLAAWAGADFEKGDAQGRMMPGTLCGLWANYDWEARRAVGGPENQFMDEAFERGIFTYPDRHLPGMWPVWKDVAGGNLLHTFGVDSTDERSLTEAVLWGRQCILEYERYYREFYPEAFKDAHLVGTGALLGIRESRRILGDYILNAEDFETRAVFTDEIGRYCYPVDLHPLSHDPEEFNRFDEEYHRLRYQQGESYGIPYRILTPRKLHNVLVAGRCVSTDRAMQGSLRVMPGCYLTGQAAGAAGAIASASDLSVHAVPFDALKMKLADLGAYLPNA